MRLLALRFSSTMHSERQTQTVFDRSRALRSDVTVSKEGQSISSRSRIRSTTNFTELVGMYGISSVLSAILLIVMTAVTVKDVQAETCDKPYIRVDKDFGYSAYRQRKAANGSVIEADGSRWLTQNGKNGYPIDVRSGADVCFKGGLVEGTHPEGMSWGQLYNRGNSAAVIFGDAPTPRFTVEGVRIAGAWDGIRPRPNAPDFTIRGVWLSGVRDDCVENDAMQAGLIEDSLFDGCYVFLSASSSTNGRENVVEIRDSLVRLQPFYGAHNNGPKLQPGHKGWFKWTSFNNGAKSKSPKLKLVDNIFLVEQRGNLNAKLMGIPDGKLADCRNNVVVWLGGGNYPAKLPDCFKVVDDISVWNSARAKWLDKHKDVMRSSDDR